MICLLVQGDRIDVVAKYLLAISGGIDSMAMLHLIATDYHGFRIDHFGDAVWPTDFVVAHFDHGIRGDQSHRDAMFVREICCKYGVPVIIGHGDLPVTASEEQARQARYDFLRHLAATAFSNQESPAIIVTAHHGDDLIETAVINMLRGTGWRGLAVMGQPGVIRPLLGWSKSELASYAIERDVAWVEDQTNYSPKYLRNRLRERLITSPIVDKERLKELIQRQCQLRQLIDVEVDGYIKKHVTSNVDGECVMCRYYLIMLPDNVAMEILRYLTGKKLTRPQLMQLLIFAKVAKPGKRMAWHRVGVRVTKKDLVISCNMSPDGHQ